MGSVSREEDEASLSAESRGESVLSKSNRN